MCVAALTSMTGWNKPVLTSGTKKVQAKLQVNEPGDLYEQEADAMANRVIQMQAPGTSTAVKPSTGLIGRSVERRSAQCEEGMKSGNKMGTVMRKPGTPAPTREQIISDVRQAAMTRVNAAYLRINGTSADFNMARALGTARGLISPNIKSLDQVVDMVGSILNKLTNDANVVIGPEIGDCIGDMGWAGYVEDNTLPIHLCLRFFTLSREEQIRKLIHEAAHASGIGKPAAEHYFTSFDCSTSGEDNWDSADAWASYIHCISGQKPDPVMHLKGADE